MARIARSEIGDRVAHKLSFLMLLFRSPGACELVNLNVASGFTVEYWPDDDPNNGVQSEDSEVRRSLCPIIQCVVG